MGRLFGTDGVRGIVNETLTCERAMEIGRAAAAVLSNNRRRIPVVLVGMDTRLSSNMLACAISAGLCSVGADVINVGVVPTPAVAYLVGKYKCNAGIMISASHNPYEYNGIKIFNEDGYKLADELEEMIESLVLDHKEGITVAADQNIGTITYSDKAIDDYIEHLSSTVLYALDGLRIAVDCANGSASMTAKKLFEKLGAEAVFLSDKPDGMNINHECGSTHMERLAAFVKDGGYDVGIAYDGDADRCLCVDENGEMIDGDIMMAIISYDMLQRGRLPRRTVVGTIMTNYGFEKFCEENNIRFVATKVGDRYVLEEMLLERYYFGGEQSGHIIFRDFSTTGDGQLTSVQLLSLMKRSGKKLSELASVMHRCPQVIINVEITAEAKSAFYMDNTIKNIIADGNERLEGCGRLIVRLSGTEPLIRIMAQGDDENLIHTVASETAESLQKCLANLH